LGDRRLLGELLIEAGIVRPGDVDLALEEQRIRGGRLCYHLMRLGKVTPAVLFLFLQEHFGVIAPDLLETLRNAPAADLIPPRLAHFYQMVPLRREGDRLLLALASVDNPNLIPAVEEMTGLRVEAVICPPGLLQESLARFFQVQDEIGVIRNPKEDNVLVLSDPSREILPGNPESLAEDAPGVVWLRALIGEAVHRHCREILLEPLEEESRVTFRHRGTDQASRAVSRQVHLGLSLCLEDLSKMVARGRSVPRDARFKLRQGERHLAVLVTWLPGIHGDAYHLRIVEERIRKEGFEDMLEDYPEARSSLDIALAGRKGALLVAAPDGHYRERIVSALVQWVRWRAGSTIFLGGPESLRLPGIELRELDKTRATPLPDALRAALQDGPDLLAALRIQTAEEAAILLEAARDRLVVAGIRKQNALEALQWLVQVGLLPEVRAGRLCGILGTRMVERICEHCRKHYDLLEEFPNLVPQHANGGLFFANVGCRACRGAGVLELEAAFEFIPGDAALVERLGLVAPHEMIRKEWARAGMKSMFSSLLARAAAGEVDVREPLRLILIEGRSAA
jgi:type IV pilus assembly protein PilB